MRICFVSMGKLVILFGLLYSNFLFSQKPIQEFKVDALGRKQGGWIYYYPNGVKMIRCNYANDTINGCVEVYEYKNGSLIVKGNVYRNLYNGQWDIYQGKRVMMSNLYNMGLLTQVTTYSSVGDKRKTERSICINDKGIIILMFNNKIDTIPTDEPCDSSFFIKSTYDIERKIEYYNKCYREKRFFYR